LTLFAFSSENWQRPEEEVSRLLELFVEAMDGEVDELNRNDIRLHFIGDVSTLRPELLDKLRSGEARTSGNRRMTLHVALSYGGRWDIAQAARALATRVAGGELDPAAIDEAAFGNALALGATPDPDLFIRTGGGQRISNFLLWNLAYTELWFTDTLWPSFDVAEFDHALASFAERERRFGHTVPASSADAC
jgi:undecaprenyl diphosphate synthase